MTAGIMILCAPAIRAIYLHHMPAVKAHFNGSNSGELTQGRVLQMKRLGYPVNESDIRSNERRGNENHSHKASDDSKLQLRSLQFDNEPIDEQLNMTALPRV